MTANERLERRKDELNKKIAKERIALIILIALGQVLYLFLNRNPLENIFSLCFAEGTLLAVVLLIYSVGIRSDKKDIKRIDYCIERNLEDERIAPDIKREFNLSNEYAEIFLKDEAILKEKELDSDYNKKKKQRDCGGRFFVRLVNDDEAEIIVKGLDEKIIGATQKVTRFGYLREYFNPKITV